jgi:glycosyltransferase involved in cell wall biosynthesis
VVDVADLAAPAEQATPGRLGRPGISVIVPTKNERQNLPRFLASLPPDVELVLCDASDDGTPELALALRPAGTVVLATPGSIAAARQAGAEASSGDLLVFADADVELDPGYFPRLRASLSPRPARTPAASHCHPECSEPAISHCHPERSEPAISHCHPERSELASEVKGSRRRDLVSLRSLTAGCGRDGQSVAVRDDKKGCGRDGQSVAVRDDKVAGLPTATTRGHVLSIKDGDLPWDAVCGPKLSRDGYGRYYRLVAEAQRLTYAAFGIAAASGSNMVLTRAAFRQLGGFRLDLRCNEDTELFLRAGRRGLRVRYDPGLVVWATDHRRLRRGLVRKSVHSLVRNALLYLVCKRPGLPRLLEHDWGYWGRSGPSAHRHAAGLTRSEVP